MVKKKGQKWSQTEKINLCVVSTLMTKLNMPFPFVPFLKLICSTAAAYRDIGSIKETPLTAAWFENIPGKYLCWAFSHFKVNSRWKSLFCLTHCMGGHSR